MTVHFFYPVFWTACNASARARIGSHSQLARTTDKSKVTCGNCKRTQAFFSRDDKPGSRVETLSAYRKS